MHRFVIVLLLVMIALAGCSLTSTEATQPPVLETQAPSPTTQAGEPAASDTPTVSEPPTQTPEPAQPTNTSAPQEGQGWIAYTGAEGNLWMVDRVSGQRRQITQDAIPIQPGQPPPDEQIAYCCARWSSDGSLLAYRREVGTAISSGFQFVFELWVYDLASGEHRMVLQNENIPGFDWQPMSQLIAYALPIPTEYFLNQSGELATGIWAVEVDTGNTYQLVAPQRGFALVNPQWSPDGRFLSFDEVFAMEGRGYFAYYDFESQEYVSWEQAIGQYDWSPGGETIAYDTLTYTATGEERIWLRDRMSDEERPLSPDYGPGYAFRPKFSPQGDQLAYLAALGGPESNQTSLFMVEVPAGEPRNLGVFTQVYSLSWSPDGSHLVFSSGPFESPQVVAVNVSEGAAAVLADGREPAWQPEPVE